MKIRAIVYDDLEHIADAVREHHKRMPVLGKFLYSKDKIKQVLSERFNDPSVLQIIAVDDYDRMVLGGFFGSVIEFPFSYDLYAQDHLFYVKPQHRSLMIATSLVAAYKKWAIEKGVLQIRLETISGLDGERYGRFAKALGFEELGRIYSMEKNNGRWSTER